MVKRSWCLRVILVLLIGCLCSGGVAQAIDLYPDLQRNADLSNEALNSWRASFENLTQGLAAIAEGLPQDQQEVINQAIALITAKLDALYSIDVYTIAENNAGEAFQKVCDYYKTRMILEIVDGTTFKEQLQALQEQGMSSEMFFMLPVKQETITQLLEMIEQNEFQAASGGSGKSRISILTAYVNPTTHEVMKGTTVVIATDK